MHLTRRNWSWPDWARKRQFRTNAEFALLSLVLLSMAVFAVFIGFGSLVS